MAASVATANAGPTYPESSPRLIDGSVSLADAGGQGADRWGSPTTRANSGSHDDS